MALRENMNPWANAREARNALADLTQRVDDLQRELDAANERCEMLGLVAQARGNEITRLYGLMACSHYRDPQTGRISPRGVFPQPNGQPSE